MSERPLKMLGEKATENAYRAERTTVADRAGVALPRGRKGYFRWLFSTRGILRRLMPLLMSGGRVCVRVFEEPSPSVAESPLAQTARALHRV